MVDPATAAAIGSGLASAFGQRSANKTTARENQRARDHQSYWNRHQITAAVEDYRNAGLNPILAYKNLPGANSGAGAGGNFGNPGAAASTSAKEVALLSAQTDLLQAQAQNVRATTATELGKPALQTAQTQQAITQSQFNQAQTTFSKAKTKLTHAQTTQAWEVARALVRDREYVEYIREATGIPLTGKGIQQHIGTGSWIGKTIAQATAHLQKVVGPDLARKLSAAKSKYDWVGRLSDEGAKTSGPDTPTFRVPFSNRYN